MPHLDALEPRRLLAVTPIAPIVVGEAPYDPATVRTSAIVGDDLYFTIKRGPGNGGQELWKYPLDGSSPASLASDRASGFGSLDELTNVNSTLYFGRYQEIYKSDGTNLGTTVVDTVSGFAHSLTNLNGTLIFTTDDGKLWRSDGTPLGTESFRNIAASNLTVVNGSLYFTASDGLWKSDGTNLGTTKVYSGTAFSLGVLGQDLYFFGTDTTLGGGLYKTSTVNGNTQRVATISWSQTDLPGFTAGDNQLFFSAFDPVSARRQLWKTNGTGAGTAVVKAVQTGTSASLGNLTAVGSQLFFTAFTSAAGNELYRSDGTSDGTALVKDIQAGSGSSVPTGLIDVGGVAYFNARESAHGYELWRSDGTATGTQMLSDIYAGPSGSLPRVLIKLDETSFAFQATDDVAGYSLFRGNASNGDVTNVGDLVPGGLSPPIARGATADGRFFFGAGDNSAIGRELYISDGTAAGTTLLKDIFTTSWSSSDPGAFTALGNTMYFAATDATHGRELWKSDGTTAGTVLLKDIYTGTSNSSSPRKMFTYKGLLYFIANDSTGSRLWKTDGTDLGTVPVNYSSGNAIVDCSSPTVMNGVLYFTVGQSLARTDGTQAGTTTVKTIPNSNSHNVTELRAINGRLYFSADDGTTNGEEPWISDGTSTGTVMLKNVNPGTSSTGLNFTGSSPTRFTSANGLVFFSANDGTHGLELWRSDGTAAGTVMVKDIAENGDIGYFATSAIRGTIVPTANSVVFVAVDFMGDAELWRSDGTEAGTFRLRDIRPGSDSSNIQNLTSIGGRIYFTADDGSGAGTELWTTDATAAGTVPLEDISTVPGGSTPGSFTDVNGAMWFVANDGVNGPSLYQLPDTTAPMLSSSKVALSSTSQSIQHPFSEDVSLALASQPLSLVNQTTGATVSTLMNYETETNTATWTFGILPDGSYRASLPSDFHDSAGNALIGSSAVQFIWSNGTSGDDALRVQRSAGGATVEVFLGTNAKPTFVADAGELRTIGFATQAGNDSLTVDLINGSPIPVDGFSFEAGSGTDTVIVNGTSGPDSMRFNNLSAVDLGAAGLISINSVQSFTCDGRGGGDTINADRGTLTFTASQDLASLSIGQSGNAAVVVAPGAHKVLVTRALSIAHTAFQVLDLNANDLIVDYSGASQLAAVQTLVNEGRSNGTWGSIVGITSTAARTANPKNTTLGVMESADFKSIHGTAALFAGQPIDATAVLVKYTYYGDTDFNGIVSFDDYSRTDSGFNLHKTGWLNGDFDGNGVVDFDDYSLIDLAFNTQGSTLRPALPPSGGQPNKGGGVRVR